MEEEILAEELPGDEVEDVEDYGYTPEQDEVEKRQLAEFLLLDDFLSKTTVVREKDIQTLLFIRYFGKWVKGEAWNWEAIEDEYQRMMPAVSGGRAKLIADLNHPYSGMEPKRRGFFRRRR